MSSFSAEKSRNFCHASAKGNLSLVTSLSLDPEVDLNWKDGYGQSPFFMACWSGFTDIVRFLLDFPHGQRGPIDYNAANKREETPFFTACLNAREKVVEMLLADGRIDFNLANERRETPFFAACLNARVKVVEMLLADGRIDCNLANERRETPFFAACLNARLKVVELLLADGKIDVNQANQSNRTPISAACSNGHEKLMEMLLEDSRIYVNWADSGTNLLYEASLKGRVGVVRRLLASTREIGAWKGDENGITALEDANFQKVSSLIESYHRDPEGVQQQLRGVIWLEKTLKVSLSDSSKILPLGCQDPKLATGLNLSHSRLTTLPPRIAAFTNLTELDLSHNPLGDRDTGLISQILMDNPSLVRTNLSSTKIDPEGMSEVLQTLVWKFSQGHFSLRFFEVDEIKLKSFEGLEIIPIVILEEGSQRTVRYLLDLFQSPEADPLYRSKLMVVGFAEMGKTSMLECLFPLTGILFSRVVKKQLLTKAEKVKWHDCFLKLIGNNLTQSEVIRDTNLTASTSKKGEDKKKKVREYFGTVRLVHKPKDAEVGPWSIVRIDDHEKPGFRICGPDGFVRELYCDEKGERDRWFDRIDGLLNRSRTHGIDIREIDCSSHPVVKGHFVRKEWKGKLEMSVWDFAGQHEYYNNHQHFLSTRSIFLVLWNVSEFDESSFSLSSLLSPSTSPLPSSPLFQGKGFEGLRFWLSSLSLHLSQAKEGRDCFKIIVVGTHFDRLSKKDQNGMGMRWELVDKLCESFGLVMSNYLEVSCVDRLENVGELQDMVFSETLGMKYMGERIPATYLLVEGFLKSLLNENRAYPIMEIEVFLFHFPEQIVRDALGLFSKWGKCCYFEDDKRLRDKVILDPQFLSKTTLAGLFRLGDEAMAKRENGIIHHRDLKVFWPNLARRSDFGVKAEELMMLMEKFGVCFVVAEDQAKPFVEQRSILPSLLPKKPLLNNRPKVIGESKETKSTTLPKQQQLSKAEMEEEEKRAKFEKHWPSRLPRNQSIEMERVFKFSVVPDELVSLILTRCHHLIQDGCVWRDFALLHLPPNPSGGSRGGRTQAILQVDLSENSFLVEVRSGEYSDGIRMLEQIREVFQQVNEKHQFAKWRECVRSPYFRSSLIGVDEITTEENDGRKVKCPETGEPILVSLLKRKAGLVPPPPQSRSGALIVKNGELVGGADAKIFDELKKYIQFFGGQIEDVAEAHRLKDELGLEEGFRLNRESLFKQHESAPDLFKKMVHLDQREGRDLRKDYLKLYFAKLNVFPEFERPGMTDVIPVVNGHSENAAWNIGMTGFSYSPSLDEGYFGSGIYFTTSLDYALGYGDCVVISLANAGNVYPVIEHPFEKDGAVLGSDGKPVPSKDGFLGKPLVGGYQSHYSIVKGGYPVTAVQGNVTDELVLFQSAQALPLFIVKMK